MNINIFVILSLFIGFRCQGQVIIGANQYTEYHPGNLPVVISVPHGGSLSPSGIPDRTCNNAVADMDANTIELGNQIDSAFVNATGCHPYLIVCNLSRAKLDCNRNLADGACGNAAAENAWTEFHGFIDSAQASAKSKFGGKAFYIDLHGHGNPIQRLELGYLLYDNELAFADNVLNSAQYVGFSSIRNLVSTNVNGYTHAQLLKGEYALGTLFGNAGYPSVPSQQIPFPGTTTNYYNGGYNTAHHTSYVQSITVNGLQIECNYTNVRDSFLHRRQFADSLVSVMLKYLKIHQNINTENCAVTSKARTMNETRIQISPNPAHDFITVQSDEPDARFDLEFMNAYGQRVLVSNGQSRLDVRSLPKGVYVVRIWAGQKMKERRKVVVE
jgi:Secretion system C-terminal sorting domain